MSIALVAHVIVPADVDGTTSPAIDTTGANLVVFCINGVFVTGGTGPYDVFGNSYLLGKQQINVGNWYFSSLWYCLDPTMGPGHTFSIDFTHLYGGGEILAFSGADGGYGLYDNGHATVGQSANSIGGVILEESDELIVSTVCNYYDDNVGIGDGLGNLFTVTDTIPQTSNMGSSAAYMVQSGGPSTVYPFWAYPGAETESAGVACAFKNGAGSGPLGGGGGGGSFVPMIGRGPGMNLSGQGGGLIGRASHAARMNARRRSAHVSR